VLKDTKFRTAFYYSDISDYQQHNYISGATSTLVYNIDMIVYGVELELTRSFRQDLSGYLAYTYQDWNAENHPMDTENTHYLLQNQPRNKVVMGLNYKLWEGGVVNLNAKYMDKRYSKQHDTMEEVIIVDVGAQHTFKLQGCDLTLRGYVNNVTDQDYQLSYGYDMPGTTAGMSMTLSF
jgi:outer membrane receptor protein involved in Fe transport